MAVLSLGLVLCAFPGAATHAGALAAEGAGNDADRNQATLPSLEERRARLERLKMTGDGQDMALPETPGPVGLSEDTAKRYQSAMAAYYEYRRAGYDHRLRVFEWQLVSTKIIFAVVLILVFAGIYFAAIQFHHGLRKERVAKPAEEAPEATEFVFSLKEFKVRSPVLGVIILTLSLAFFYLYLVYVYPIVNVF